MNIISIDLIYSKIQSYSFLGFLFLGVFLL